LEKQKNKLTVCLTHDVDRTNKSYQYVTQTIKNLFKGNIQSALYHLSSIFRKNPYWNFGEIILIEKKLNVKSTFFFLDESIQFKLLKPSKWMLSLGRYNLNKPKIKQVIKKLDNEGWEIGLHGSYNSYYNKKLLKKEKIKLEKILGHRVIGVRQHYLNLSKKTWENQENLGFKYDASFGMRREIGFKENKFKPFNKGKRFIVFPLAIMDSCLMSKKEIRKEYLKIIKIAEKEEALLVLNWHQRVFNEKEFPGYKKIYEEIIQELKKRNAKFQLLCEVQNEITGRIK
jgi:peptidoglycan/xylan/chitin deacetylase (PgdA/CDA1 family)